MFPGDDAAIARAYPSFDADGTPDDAHSSADEDHVGRYRFIRELGRGAQGVVHLAEDEHLHRLVALKLLRGLGPGAAQTLRRFQREAEVTSRLDHPGLCAVHDVGTDPVPYIAMRYVEGDTLDRKIHTGRAALDEDPTSLGFVDLQSTATTDGDEVRDTAAAATPRKGEELSAILRTIEGAARALHVAHEAGIVHRDVKPGNIIVIADGTAVILDFGLAHDEGEAGRSLTMTGDLMGTPAYMSPEQITAKRIRIDRRTDVYSLGVTLYECLTLRRPFEAPTREGLYRAILMREAEDPRRRNPVISKDLAVVVATAMAKDVDARYATALELAEELRRVRTFEPIVARPAGPLLRLRRWSQRNPALAVAVLGVFVALALSAGIFFVQNEKTKTALVKESAALVKEKEAVADRDLALIERQAALDDKTAALTREQSERAEKETALADFERLADVKRLQEALALAEDLYPARLEKVAPMESWLATYRPIAQRLPDHEAALARLRDQADRYDEAAQRRDHAADFATLDDLRAQRKAVEAERDETDSATIENRLEKELDELDDRILDLDERTKTRLSWTFGGDDATRWKHEVLAQLVADVKAFADPKTGTLADVEKRLETAKTIAAKTVDRFQAPWNEAIAYAKQPEPYSGLDLAPQPGLIPLGQDPTSKLLEFFHKESHGDADLPVRGTDGRFVLTEKTGIILVLIPAGTFAMGAQSSDASQPHYDADSRSDESPVHEVALDAYFVGKYEVTQGQWERLTGGNPSSYKPGLRFGDKTTTWLHPVEQVSWEMATESLRRYGLTLPTEAQWEYGARAGTSTVWCSGGQREDLDGWGNLADSSSARGGATWAIESDLDDGYVVHAPVGRFLPNRFGLHDVIGNVWELCLDLYGAYTAPVAPGHGERLRGDGSGSRVVRGGGFGNTAEGARSAFRYWDAPGFRIDYLGLRAGAQVHP